MSVPAQSNNIWSEIQIGNTEKMRVLNPQNKNHGSEFYASPLYKFTSNKLYFRCRTIIFYIPLKLKTHILL